MPTLRLWTKAATFACALALITLSGADCLAADANPAPLNGFARLGQSAAETRTVTLRQLGLLTPVTLTAPDTRNEFFLPVPANVPISDATLQLEGGYIRGDGGRTTLLVSLDGSPVSARSFDKPEGNVAVNLGVDGSPRAVGFVRVGLGYSSVINDNACTDQTAIGNVLRVDPATSLTYRFDPADVHDLRTAWSALPYAPVLTIAGRSLDAGSLDTAWRADALLQRDGKRPTTQPMPAVGTSVDLTGLDVPSSLRAIPAFDALASAALKADASKHRVANAAELGAILALAPRTVFGPDVLVSDARMRASLNAAFNALQAQIATSAADMLPAFNDWMTHSASQLVTPLEAGEARVAHYGGRAVIVVADNAGVAALASSWRPIDVSRRVVVHRFDTGGGTHGDEILLSDLGGEPRSVDVHSTASWEANFDLADASGNGKLPDELILDLAASPTLSDGAATATVYLNDVMIGARLLDKRGLRERLSLKIPRYALARTNNLRVSFRRQPDAGCQARQSYPVAVLPSSYLKLAEGTPGNDFVGMVVRYAAAATVIVPQSYLDDAVDSVPRLAVLTGAAGIAPLPAKFSVVANGASAKPSGPFLAADVPVADQHNPVTFSSQHLELATADGNRLIDVSGLTRLAVLSVASSGSTHGIVYRSTEASPVLTDKLQLSHGNVAIVDSSGVLKRFDTEHTDDLADTGSNSSEWVTRHWLRWGIPLVLLVLLVLLIVLANVARKRHIARTQAAQRAATQSQTPRDTPQKPQDRP